MKKVGDQMSGSKAIAKVIGDKRRWRAYKQRTRELPENYVIAVEAIERYAMRFGLTDADSAASFFEDVLDLFERAAADETPIRDIVGDDPVEFVDSLISNYPDAGYVAREQERLVSGIRRAAGEIEGDES
jgi:DNA-binding ferritin-like protein (Dps family)